MTKERIFVVLLLLSSLFFIPSVSAQSAGEIYTGTGPCPPGASCDGSQGCKLMDGTISSCSTGFYCYKNQPDGEGCYDPSTGDVSCGIDGNCVSNDYFCDSGLCAPKRNYGGACTDNSQCLSSKCTDGSTCGCTFASSAKDCGSKRYCDITVFTGSFTSTFTCQSKFDGGTACATDTQCLSSKCEQGKCTAPPPPPVSTYTGSCPSYQQTTSEIGTNGKHVKTTTQVACGCSSGSACQGVSGKSCSGTPVSCAVGYSCVEDADGKGSCVPQNSNACTTADDCTSTFPSCEKDKTCKPLQPPSAYGKLFNAIGTCPDPEGVFDIPRCYTGTDPLYQNKACAAIIGNGPKFFGGLDEIAALQYTSLDYACASGYHCENTALSASCVKDSVSPATPPPPASTAGCATDHDCTSTTPFCVSGQCASGTTSTTCSGGITQEILKLADPVNGGEAEIVGGPSFTNSVCYDALFGKLGSGNRTCAGTDVVVKLTSGTNSHAAVPESTNPDYITPVCYQGLSCKTVNGNCPSGWTGVVKLSDPDNAHTALYTSTTVNYSNSICCQATIGAGGTGGSGTKLAGAYCSQSSECLSNNCDVLPSGGTPIIHSCRGSLGDIADGKGVT
ncbi:MAG: hypothetical protein HZA83_00145, partial [Thaumarchaeota archaeon]|nr:hypothetical protein [Nitrososphaerota archaeon]